MKTLIPTALCAFTLTAALCAKNTVVVYDLKGKVPESGAASGDILSSISNPKRPITHYDLVESINFAIKDKEVKAILIDIDDASMGLAQLQEVRRLLLQAKAAKKDVWLFTESYSLSTAMLGSACNHFTLMPESGSSFQGLHSESMYFKGLLDKIGVKMDVVHIGDFKSAGEQFYRTGPSEAADKQSSILFDSLYSQIISQVASGRSLKDNDVKKIIDQGFVTSQQLLDAKLVDHLEYRTDLIKKIKAKYKDYKFDKSYALPDTGAPKIEGIMDLFKLMAGSKDTRDLSKPYIAIIPLEGAITDASIAPVRKEVLKATKDPMCKGLVLRVNSPGGSAKASEVLWEATEEFKQTKRPFIVSMGGVAASGGYYVSALADTIYAETGTITGSIGVVGMKPALGGAMEKLGITTHSMKRGQYADLYNTSRAFSAKERELVKNSMLDVYATFKKRVTDGRGDRIKGDLEKLAGGRVYSGADALKIGLIDKVGGLNEAIEECLSKCGDGDIFTHLFPEPKNPMEALFTSPASGNDELIQMQSNSVANKLSTTIFQQDVLNIMGDQKKMQLQLFLNQLESMQKNHIQLIGPAGLNIQTK